MLARCPACHTVFRVRSEQLRAHHGQVRCGSCLLPFDALDNLIEDATSPAAPKAPEPAPDRSDRFFVLEDKAADTFSDELDFELPDALVPQRAAQREANVARQEPEEHTPEPEHRSEEDTDTPAHRSWGDNDDLAQLEPAEEYAPDTLMPGPASPDRLEPGFVTPPRVEDDSLAEDPAPALTEPPTDTEDEFADYAPPAPPPARHGLTGLAIGLLSGMLAAQLLYLFRADLARDWPSLRPVLVNACHALGCTVELPHIAGLISVESSDLQSEPGKAANLVLNATIRNRAPHPLAWPHLELTLTDARDRPLVRRVLTPQDWFPDADLEQGFAAGRDIAVTLPFSADGLGASGYRIYAFYP